MAKKDKKKQEKKEIDRLARLLFILVFLLATTGFTALRVKGDESESLGEIIDKKITPFQTEGDVRLSEDMTPIVVDEDSPFYDVFRSQDRINVLLLGVADGMTDTIMLGSYDMENQKIDIISIPRDTYYYRAGYKNYASYKINSIYNSQGLTKLATSVSDILYGMPIHYYAIVDYEDVRKIMGVIGGVQIDVPFHMKYDDTTKGHELHIDIPGGLQTIDASNVVEFLRFRHTNPWFAAQGYKSYYSGDIQRSEVQRDFIKKTMAECLKLGNLKDVIRVALENIESDLSYSMAVKVAVKAMGGLDEASISTHMLPGIDQVINELSFWVKNESQTYQMLEEIYGISEEVPATEAAITQ